jgi:ABC-type uncharacterized transport system permease subunit
MNLANPITTCLLAVLAVMSVVASVRSLHRLSRPEQCKTAGVAQRAVVAAIMLTSLGLFVRFWLFEEGWQPVTSHRDGLLLMSFLLAGAVLFIQSRTKLVGLAAFALPVLTFVLTWAFCASAWTYHAFDLPSLHPVWRGVHLAGVYLGTVFCGVATVAGGMYLYVHGRLKCKQKLGGLGRLASLEALENTIIRAATLGFVLLTLGLVSGVVVISEDGTLTRGGWFGPKVVLGVLAWGVYAVLMNVRYTSRFRGRRAAWLSIAGLVLLLATYVVVTSLPQTQAASPDSPGPDTTQHTPTVHPIGGG